jgi:hypothetical protein
LAVTAQQARELALSFDGASEAPHFDRSAFRTPRRIFATLGAGGADLNLMLDPVIQEFYCEQAPGAFAPVPGGWGRKGATRCLLHEVDPDTFRGALAAAHERANLPRARRATNRD